jgi:hypothetical protein
MGPGVLAHLQDVSLRSLAGVSGRHGAVDEQARRSAAASHAVWSVVLAGILLLFAVGPILPSLPLRILAETSPRMLPQPAWRDIVLVLYVAVALTLCNLAAGRMLAHPPISARQHTHRRRAGFVRIRLIVVPHAG